MNEKGCLLIHGFTGSRRELEPLAEQLGREGFQISLPVLKGHEATVEELRAASRRDWVQGVQSALDALKARCQKVIVVGFSMGGLLAANLAPHCDVDGYVFINTPIYYWGLRRMLSDMCRDFRAGCRKYRSSFGRTPFHALLEFQKLLSQTKPMFRSIQSRSLILQSVNDDVVDPKSADFIFSQLQGRKELKRIAKGRHVVMLGEGSGQACSLIQNFLLGF